MTGDETAYGRAVDYLARYAAEDWVMMPVVVSEARGVAGSAASKAEIVDAVMELASSLIERRVVPGDLDDVFEPWTGSPEDRLKRIRHELDEMLARDELPIGPEICWFHKIES